MSYRQRRNRNQQQRPKTSMGLLFIIWSTIGFLAIMSAVRVYQNSQPSLTVSR